MTLPPLLRLPALLIACLALPASPSASAHDHAQDVGLRASEPQAPDIPSPVAVPLEAAQRSTLPRHAVEARIHDTTLQCEGVALVDLLRSSGAIPDGRVGSPHLSRYVLAEGRDGYRVLFSLAELDPGTGNRDVFVVDACGGRPLNDADGPVRLLVPGDVRAARSVRQLHAVTVVVAP